MVFVNKLVLNAAPELPVLFLLNQMLIAVVLLHLSAALSPRVKLPTWDYSLAKGLLPVISINAVGLVWNTLCLRAVDASYFQVSRIHPDIYLEILTWIECRLRVGWCFPLPLRSRQSTAANPLRFS